MKKLAAWATDAKTIILLIILVLATITKGVSWAMDVEKNAKKSADLQEQMVQIQKQMADSDERQKKFIMDLWRIDPDVVKKWSVLPNEPDSTDEFAPWWEFEVNGLLRYQVGFENDTTKLLFVDTVYWREK